MKRERRRCDGFCWNASDVNRPPNTKGDRQQVSLDEAELVAPAHYDLLPPDEARDRLIQADAAVAQLVKLRYSAG